MNIDSHSLSLALRTAGTAPGPAQWRVGMVLHATVRHEAGRLLLDIRGQAYEARPTAQLPALRSGEQIMLRVTQAEPPVLRLLQPPQAAPSALAAALRQLLPQQPSLTPLIAMLGAANLRQTAAVAQALTAARAQLPEAAQAQRPDGLASLLARSGLFLEATLARAGGNVPLAGAPAPLGRPPSPPAEGLRAPAPADLKSTLLRLVASLKREAAEPLPAGAPARSAALGPPLGGAPQPLGAQAPTLPASPVAQSGTSLTAAAPPAGGTEANADNERIRQLVEVTAAAERALSRVQLLQLHAASADGLDMLFEIPLRFGNQLELLQLRLQEEDAAAAQGEDAERALHVRLAFDFADIGPLHASIRLAGSRVSTAWWAEQHDTANTLQRMLPELEARLDAQGFQISAMSCSHGRPPEPIAPLAATTRGILDEQA